MARTRITLTMNVEDFEDMVIHFRPWAMWHDTNWAPLVESGQLTRDGDDGPPRSDWKAAYWLKCDRVPVMHMRAFIEAQGHESELVWDSEEDHDEMWYVLLTNYVSEEMARVMKVARAEDALGFRIGDIVTHKAHVWPGEVKCFEHGPDSEEDFGKYKIRVLFGGESAGIVCEPGDLRLAPPRPGVPPDPKTTVHVMINGVAGPPEDLAPAGAEEFIRIPVLWDGEKTYMVMSARTAYALGHALECGHLPADPENN